MNPELRPGQYFPPADFDLLYRRQPDYVPPRGRWEWIPDHAPRPFFPEPIWIGIDPAGSDFTVTFVELRDGSLQIQ